MIHLYYFPECPFCQKVLRKIKELNLEEGKDIKLILAYRGTKEAEELKRIGGKVQFPFITDGDLKMYESDDIVAYLEKKFNKASEQ